MSQRSRDFSDLPRNRRRNRSLIEGKPGRPDLDLDTPEGAKARQVLAEQDIADLQRKWREEESPSGGAGVPVIDLGDSTPLVGYSRGWWFVSPGTIANITAALDQPGETDTTGIARKNGMQIATFTLPAGATSVVISVDTPFDAADVWQMQQTQVGTNALGLTYFAEVI